MLRVGKKVAKMAPLLGWMKVVPSVVLKELYLDGLMVGWKGGREDGIDVLVVWWTKSMVDLLADWKAESWDEQWVGERVVMKG